MAHARQWLAHYQSARSRDFVAELSRPPDPGCTSRRCENATGRVMTDWGHVRWTGKRGWLGGPSLTCHAGPG